MFSDSPISPPDSTLAFWVGPDGPVLTEGIRFVKVKWDLRPDLNWSGLPPNGCWIIAVLNSNSLRARNQWLNVFSSALSVDYCTEEIRFYCVPSSWLLTTLTTCFFLSTPPWLRAPPVWASSALFLIFTDVGVGEKTGKASSYHPYLAWLKTSRDERRDSFTMTVNDC